MHQPLIIVGTHRSGTSMLTRILLQAGIFFGHNRLPKEEEARHFLELNSWILRMTGTNWDYPLPAFEQLKHPEDVELLAKGVRLRLHGRHTYGFLGGRFLAGRGNLARGLPFAWGFKDPRSSITLPVWLRIYPEAKVLRVRRHGVPVAASLHSRFHNIRKDLSGRFHRTARWGFGMPSRHRVGSISRCRELEGGLAIWDEYEKILDHWLEDVKPGQRLTLRYEDLLAEPSERLEEIGDWAGLPSAITLDRQTMPDPERSNAWRDDEVLVSFARRQSALLERHGYSA